MSFITIFYQHCTKGSSQCDRPRERKGVSVVKERIKLPLFADDTYNLENKVPIDDLPELMSLASLWETKSVCKDQFFILDTVRKRKF